jgi:hypothetical protein
LANRNLKGDVNVQFEEPTSRINLDSGSSVKTLFGRISKWLKDLKAVAFSGSYTDLSDKPTIPPATAVKGNAETTYRTGNVNLTPANIGAATSTQGAKADSAVQTIQMNGSTVTKTGGTVNLGTVITAHQDISGKADKSATVSTVAYDATNKKLTKTINGTTSDVVTTAQLKTDMALSKSDVGLGNVGNFKAVSTVASQGLTDTEKANARANIGLGNVNNTSDANKPISTAAQAALDKQQAQIDKALKQTGYNLLEITSSSQTINGVTFTVDKAAGTITANGTATAVTWIPLSEQLSDILETGKSYYMTGCPSGGSFYTKYALYVALDGSTVWRDEGGGEQYLIPQSGTLSALHLLIRSGITVSNLVFKPMIVPAELAGVPFQPYAKSNAELTSGKLDVTGMTYYKSYPEQFLARAQKGSVYYELELDTTVAGLAGLSHSSGSSIGLISGTPILRNSGGDMLLFTPDGCISGQPANSYSRFALRNYSSGAYIGFLSGIPGVYTSDDTPMCTFTAVGIKMDDALISGRSGTPTLVTNTGTVYEFKDDGIYLNGTRIAP